MASKKRFKVILNEGGLTESKAVIVDTNTGVNYLWYSSSFGGSLSVMYNTDGTIMVSPEYINNQNNRENQV